MGSGIAQVAAVAGHPVILQDLDEGAIARARAGIDKALARETEKNRLTRSAAEAARERIRYVVGGDLSAFAPCRLVIEAIVERLGPKRESFAALERVVAPEAMLATNTSALSITTIAAACQRPERVVGLHFFNPAPMMPLVEVVRGHATPGALVDAACALVQRWGKTTVVAADTPGFIVNRIARPFYGEALRILDEGIADCATIDWAMRTLGGFRMGPFELMDLIGNDVNFAVTSAVYEGFFFDPRYKPSLTQRRLVDANLLGRKTGRGWYDYRDGAAPPAPREDPALGSIDPGADPGDADQRGGRRRLLGRRHAGGHRPRDGEGGELSERAHRVGRGARVSGRARAPGTPAGGVRGGSLPAEPAPPAPCRIRWNAPRVSSLPADPELRAAAIVRHMLAHDAFSRWLGVEIVDLEPARVTLRMAVRQDMTNGFGVCHGGVTFAFADSALAFASNTGGKVTVSIENSMTYPAAVRVGDLLLAEAEREASSRRLAYYRVRVTRGDGAVVALFRGTVFQTDREHDMGRDGSE